MSEQNVNQINTNGGVGNIDRIWLLRCHEYGGTDSVNAYVNKINASDALYNAMIKKWSKLSGRGDDRIRTIHNDDSGMLYTKDGKVLFDWNIVSCELNSDPEPFVGPEEDKFYFNDSSFKWWYFNPDGNDGKGQYVENNLYLWDVIEGVEQGYDKNADEFFMEWLSQGARQYLHDNDGSNYFKNVDSWFRNEPCDLIGCTEETMNAIIKWANNMRDDNSQNYL